MASAANGQVSLFRTTCSGTIATSLTQTSQRLIGTADPFTATALCGTTSSCSMTLSWANPAYSVTLNGTRWVNATTTTTTGP
jgi:hypothetical protein